MSFLLAKWKRDKATLIKRFDRNQDGVIDPAGWGLARNAAELEIRQEHLQVRLDGGIHVLRKPERGQPFLIVDRLPDKVLKRYQIWSWVYLSLCLPASD